MTIRNPAALGALLRGDIDNAIVGATPGGIEAQEKAGQILLVNSSDMPKDLSPSREAFEAVGFKFGAPIDEIFMAATLPQRWTRIATQHSMHSLILDTNARKRVSVFYKAAFYDRRADARLLRRYNVEARFDDTITREVSARTCAIVITDGNDESVIWRSPQQSQADPLDGPEKEARVWLDHTFPEWNDPLAYW